MTFARFLDAVDRDSTRPPLLRIGLCIALLLLWATWFLLARVPVYEVSDHARLEMDRALAPIEAVVTGRIVRASLTVGSRVRAGDVLVELDAEADRLQLEEARARLASLSPQMARLQSELAAESQALAASRTAAEAIAAETLAQVKEADAAAGFAESDAARTARLHAEGLVSDVALLRATSDAEGRRAAATGRRLAVERLAQDQQSRESDRRVRWERLKLEIARLEAERTATTAAAHRLGHEIERRRIRAPIAGTVGDVAGLRIGAVVTAGERLGAIVPAGILHAVAGFEPHRAFGRLRAGQPARLRLDGFPWSEYGSVRATVTSVAEEVRDDRVRVELEIYPEVSSAIAFQHGQPGAVDVEVEQVTPATLVLRSLGRLGAPSGVRRPIATDLEARR